MKQWTSKFSPERYLQNWPKGPQADLAREHITTRGIGDPVKDDIDPDLSPKSNGQIRFFSPRSNGLQVVVTAIAWIKEVTPAGERTIQAPGKTAKFENHLYISDDPEIIEYLTNVYSDRRFPVVRNDMTTASAVN